MAPSATEAGKGDPLGQDSEKSKRGYCPTPMIASLVCPRCKSENASGQHYCQKCGFGLIATGAVGSPSESSKDARDWLGKTISDKYRVVNVLGEGGFGTVFEVEQTLLGGSRTFALKLLHEELAEDEHYRARFVREASLAMELVHPNAITVRDFGSTETGRPYFTMDYCHGESMKETLAREGQLIVNRAVAIASQILNVLEAAHDRQIIHRDLKPENIFLERDSHGLERVKVGDFGLARTTRPVEGSADLTKGGIVGTPGYMSPEQARGEPLDARSDLFSMGVLLFEMVAGDLPPRLDRKRPQGRLSNYHEEPRALATLRERIPGNMVVPSGILAVVARALEPKPSQRYQSAAEFREALHALPTYTPTYAEPDQRVRVHSTGRRLGWAFACVVVAGGLFMLLPANRQAVKEKLAGLFDSGVREDNAKSGGQPQAGAPQPLNFGALTEWVPYRADQVLRWRFRSFSDGKPSDWSDLVHTVHLASGQGANFVVDIEDDITTQDNQFSWRVSEAAFESTSGGATTTHLKWSGTMPEDLWTNPDWIYSADRYERVSVVADGKTYEGCLVVTARGTGANKQVTKTVYYARGIGEVRLETRDGEKLTFVRERLKPQQ